MPPVKKYLVQAIGLISINSCFFLVSDRTNAQTTVSKSSPRATTDSSTKFTTVEKQSEKAISSGLSIFKITQPSNLNITSAIAVETSESSPPSETGSPALRRQPTGGERFEPRRIPLRVPFPKQPYRASPSITIINPSAYGASWGSLGIGFGFQERARFTDEGDGVIGLGFGLGDARKNVGAQVGISLVDVSEPSNDGAVNLKLHRRLPQDFSVALGIQGLTTWGETDGGSSVYGVTTKRFRLRKDRTKAFSELYTTLGLGGGQFRSESDIDNGNETLGVFGSIAVKIIQPLGFVTEWTGQDLTIGIPVVLFENLPLVIVPAITDVTGTAGDGTRFVVGVGYSFSF